MLDTLRGWKVDRGDRLLGKKITVVDGKQIQDFDNRLLNAASTVNSGFKD